LATHGTAGERVVFGDYELDCRTGELRRNGASIKLQPRPAKVLSILVSRAGEIVTREELSHQVWGSETYVDFEHGLNFAIRKIRGVLEDDPEQPRFVETIPKRGYRFIATVSNPAPPQQAQKEILPAKGPSRALPATMFYTGAVLLAGILGLTWYLRTSWFGRASASEIRSLAVLPLRNLSNDSNQEYFSDGMTDELITDLAKASGLRVISHTSVERYKGTKLSLPQIARELGGVDAVVEGTVLRSGDRVRITAQLIDGRSDQHLWADSYERDLRDVLVLQTDVARAIAGEVALKLSPSQQERLWTARRVVPEAHEAYLKGIFDSSKLTPEALQSGIGHFDEAIKVDPDYAPAYAEKAEAYGWATGLGIMPSSEALPKARIAANKALELDDTLSQAHHSLAWVNYAFDWNFQAAETEFRRAVELNVNDVTAHLWYGMFLAQRGRIKESLAEMNQAEQLDPRSLIVNGLGVTPLLESRQYDAAIEQVNKVLLMDPNSGLGHWMLLTAYERKGDLARAIDEREKQATLWGQSPADAARQIAPLRNAYASSAAKGYWQTLMASMEPDLAKPGADPYGAAVVLARAGEKSRALAALEKSCAARSTELLYWLNGEPAFDSLRADPRFQNILRRIGMHSPFGS
jgi:TolB-like protein/DNA-binding winged helix-turn-helix (wHTH) protein/Flp pilus assembly protein TadD